MKKILSVLGLSAILLLSGACKKDDGNATVAIRDYQEQYNVDIAEIETYLKTHKCTPIFNAHGDVVRAEFAEVEEGSPEAIWASPLLASRETVSKGVTYKIYYLKFKTGGGADPNNLKLNPCNVDAVLAAYKGHYLYRAATSSEDGSIGLGDQTLVHFETNDNPQSILQLESVVRGWSEIMPQFRPGEIQLIDGEPTQYSDYGAGVMFLPSGMGYFNSYNGSIPSYSPLVFFFKLYAVQQLDHDNDGIPSYYEDLDGDGYVYYNEDLITDDSDGDGIPNFRDVDDDDDRVQTQKELLIDYPNGTQRYNFFNCPDASGDATNPNRIKRYLDPSWPVAN